MQIVNPTCREKKIAHVRLILVYLPNTPGNILSRCVVPSGRCPICRPMSFLEIDTLSCSQWALFWKTNLHVVLGRVLILDNSLYYMSSSNWILLEQFIQDRSGILGCNVINFAPAMIITLIWLALIHSSIECFLTSSYDTGGIRSANFHCNSLTTKLSEH